GEDVERRFCVVDRDGAIIELFEQSHGNRFNVRIVLHDQDRFTAASRLACGFGRNNDGDWGVAAGKVDGHLRALTELAGYGNCTAGLARKTVGLRKTKASTLSSGFGGEKWFEYSCQQLRRNAGSRVGNGKCRKFTLDPFHGLGAAQCYIGCS